MSNPVSIIEVTGNPAVVQDVTVIAGPAGMSAYSHAQDVGETVWTISHALGYDPAGIIVIDADGYMLDGFGVQYLLAGRSLRLSFDIAVSGVAYLS